MIHSTSKALRVSAVIFAGLLTIFLYKAILHRPATSHRPARLRVEEPVVVILVHPSPSLNKAANFELKRVIARTWAKDVEDFGASVFFVGEHEGETVMRRPSEFQGRAQSLSPRFGQGSLLAKAYADGGAAEEAGYSKEEPMRKMLIPSVLENGQTDDPSGLLKAFNFFYNNTSLQAGPALRTYSFILNTDTTHYIHVENLVATLLSSRPRRLLTMKDDPTFTGSVSEASRCSAEDFGDRAVPQGESNVNNENANAASGSTAPEHVHWTLSRTHVVSKQLVAIVGPHLHQCIKDSASTRMDSGEAFQNCVKKWASNPLFWNDGYCGRLAALRYRAPAPGSTLSSWGSSSTLSYTTRKERRGPPPTPQEFEEFYKMRQQERELLLQQEQQGRAAGGGAAAVDAEDQNEDNLLLPRDKKREEDARRMLQELMASSSSSGSAAQWTVASGLTRAEDFRLLYQSLADREDEKEEYLEELDDY